MLVCVTGCATRAISPATASDLSRAAGLVNEGCYRCLQEALAIYESAAASNPSPATARGALQAAVLVAIRARELGLPDTAALDAARTWAARQPPGRAPSGASAETFVAETYVAALQLVAGEVSGMAPEERERRNRERRQSWPKADEQRPAAREALTPAVATDLVAQYLAVAIDCEDARARKAVNHEEILQRYPQPLMRFRVALCGIPGLRVDALRQADPRWTDTLLFEGRQEMSRFPAPDVGRAAELFEAAHSAFPESTAMRLALGNARNALEEHAAALAHFDAILAHEPMHREALLGRLLSLSYLRHHYDAIRTATVMVELGTYHMGDAYYWRAWNRYQVHDLGPAWGDVEEATKRMVNTAVYTLAGFIAYAQRDLDTAVDRLVRAYQMDSTNCEAVWTEGMVRVDREQWEHSAARFVTAADCFASDAAAARAAIATAQNSAWADAVKSRRIAAATKRAESSHHRHAQAAFNAASSYLRLGRKADGLRYAETAAQHPLLKDKAGALRATIEKLR